MRLVDKPRDNDNVKNWGKVHFTLQGLPKLHLTSLSPWDPSSIHLIQYSASFCCCGKERLRNVQKQEGPETEGYVSYYGRKPLHNHEKKIKLLA